MNIELFEQLLYEEETPSLDFKSEQYRFAKADNKAKSELLKDILGFANSWRRSTAYILIGVKEVRGGRSTVLGIDAKDHLDDHSLQQFVNNLTNRPIHFHYEAFAFEGKQVGILVIEQQQRPFFLKRDYGALKRGEVYVRRGTSTTPAAPADPDEIARMGMSDSPDLGEPSIQVQFEDPDTSLALGDLISFSAKCHIIDDFDGLPDYDEVGTTIQIGNRSITSPRADPFTTVNHDFYRDVATYQIYKELFRKVRLRITNAGAVLAKDVRVELLVPADGTVYICQESELPEYPERHTSRMPNVSFLGSLRRVFQHAGCTTVERVQGEIRVYIECKDLQPGRSVTSDSFHIALTETASFPFSGRILASNLSTPTSFTLSVSAEIKRRAMKHDEVMSYSQKSWMGGPIRRRLLGG